MWNYEYAQRRVALKKPSDFAMSRREFVDATRRMNEALFLADLTLETLARVRPMLLRIARCLSAAFADARTR